MRKLILVPLLMMFFATGCVSTYPNQGRYPPQGRYPDRPILDILRVDPVIGRTRNGHLVFEDRRGRLYTMDRHGRRYYYEQRYVYDQRGRRVKVKNQGRGRR